MENVILLWLWIVCPMTLFDNFILLFNYCSCDYYLLLFFHLTIAVAFIVDDRQIYFLTLYDGYYLPDRTTIPSISADYTVVCVVYHEARDRVYSEPENSATRETPIGGGAEWRMECNTHEVVWKQ